MLVGQSSIADLMKRAEAGDAVAQDQLGRTYDDGNGVPQDYGQALKWYGKAAEQGNASAQNSLGIMYALGRGVNRDKAEAVVWYKKAAKQGLAEASYNLGISYYNGDGVQQNFAFAYGWLAIALSRGDSQAEEALKRTTDELHGRLDEAKFRLAELYASGQEVPRDFKTALALYHEVANMNVPQPLYASAAQYKLCELYFNGQDVPQDYLEARSWCKKAAKTGTALGFMMLGRMAEQGLAGKKDLKEAADWYQDAAIMHLLEGYMQAGRVFMQEGSTASREQAFFWFLLALHFKIAGAEAELQKAGSGLTQKEINLQMKRAVQWLRSPDWEREQRIKWH